LPYLSRYKFPAESPGKSDISTPWRCGSLATTSTTPDWNYWQRSLESRPPFYLDNDLEKIKNYCLRDVEVTARIFLAMHPQLEELDIEVHQPEDSKKDQQD
jgi:hypothetical protein